MGIVRTINEWEVEVGENVGGYVVDALTGTANFICGLRAKYPNSFFDRSFGRGIANAVCSVVNSDAVLPDPKPFTGGQCPGVEYEILIEGERRFNNGAPTPVSTRIVAFGPIDDINLARNSPATDPRTLVIQVFARDVAGNEALFIDQYGGVGVTGEILSIQINRLDGLIDSCGDSLPSFRPDPPRDPNDFSDNFNVSNRDENGDLIDTVEIPVELTEEESYDFPICVMVDGREICLDIDGWSISDAPKEEEKEEEEEEFEEIEVLDYVLITVGEIKPESPQIKRPDAKNSEVFSGYIAWSYIRNGIEYFLPAMPVRKKRNAYKAPEGIESYATYTNFGMTFSVTEVKRIEKVLIVEPEPQ